MAYGTVRDQFYVLVNLNEKECSGDDGVGELEEVADDDYFEEEEDDDGKSEAAEKDDCGILNNN
jgi:hypothetical protein